MLRQTAAFFLIRAENLPGIIVVSALRRGYFLDRFADRRKQNGGNVYKRRARWTVVIGGRSDICPFL